VSRLHQDCRVEGDIDPACWHWYAELLSHANGDDNPKLLFPFKGPVLDEEPLLHADAEPFSVEIAITDLSPEGLFLAIVRNQSKGLEGRLQPGGGSTNGNSLATGGIELPHRIALVIGAMPAADLRESAEFLERLVTVFEFPVARINGPVVWQHRNRTLERIFELPG
jgi:hypothetical protein